MTTQTIEQIDSETCVFHIRSLRDLSVSESIESCRHCTKEMELLCLDYKPISRYNEPIRRGSNAYLIMMLG